MATLLAPKWLKHSSARLSTEIASDRDDNEPRLCPKSLRLCRLLMCGRPLAFRQVGHLDFWAMPKVRAELRIHYEPERKRRALPHIRQCAVWPSFTPRL